MGYSYHAGVNGSTTARVASITNNGSAVSYTYDQNGNIESITDGTKFTKYYYNELNEVIREDNGYLNKSITYSYDAGGNILNKKEYAYTNGTLGTVLTTIAYTYGDTNWKDKLTAYNGKAISYDAIGNPLSYDGWTYTWENGRQLKSLSNASTSLSFKYNSDGIRTEKNVNGVTTKYTVFGDKVSFETTGSDKIHYSYDASGNLFSMNLNGTEYYYVRNAQGDITGLIDNAGNLVVSYTYDTWGKLISTTGSLAGTVGVKNPYRYRGYRYDNETGLYYLQSRYYNPDWGRFVNADGLTGLNGKLLGHNMFAYCVNNPVNNYDPTGFLHMESAGFSTLTVPHTVQSNKSVRSVRPNTSVAIPVAIGVGLESLGNVSRTIAGIVGADRVLHIIPKTSIPQTYTPFLASAKTAAKIVLVVTTFAELSGTWDPMVKMSNSQRLEKSAIQVGGTLVALGVGALVSAPIIAAGFAGGTVSIIIGIGAGFVVDYAVANAIGNIQKEIYNARGYE